MQNTAYIDLPPELSFKATVYSHGWCELAPFSLDTENWRLRYVFRDDEVGAIPAVIFEEDGKIRVDIDGPRYDSNRIAAATRHLLRLDDDLTGFYASISGHERLAWIGERRAGRMLRSATVFEDLVKTICTTNCSWALTKNMVSNLVAKLGASPGSKPRSSAGHPNVNESRHGYSAAIKPAAPLPANAFPTAEAMATVSADFYRSEIRAGYRSPYLVKLAEAVASGELDPQTWLSSDLPTAELKKEMKKVTGVGDYAAENLLKLVGRYDGLALDSWLRSQFYKNHNNEKKCSDKKIEKHYKNFGEWRALVIWCDMTEKWITESEPRV